MVSLVGEAAESDPETSIGSEITSSTTPDSATMRNMTHTSRAYRPLNYRYYMVRGGSRLTYLCGGAVLVFAGVEPYPLEPGGGAWSPCSTAQLTTRAREWNPSLLRMFWT